MNDKEKVIELRIVREVFSKYIKNCKDNCYCNPEMKCDNCKGKEYLQDIFTKIERVLKDESN